VESTNGAIQVVVEHWKIGHLWKEGEHWCLLESLEARMHCNNENWFGIFFFIYPTTVCLMTRDVHRCVMFNDIGCTLFGACNFYYNSMMVLLNIEALVLYCLCMHQCVCTLKVHDKKNLCKNL
jgi:hypothetical protein